MALQQAIDCNPNSVISTAGTLKPGGGSFSKVDQAVAKTTPGGGKRQFITQVALGGTAAANTAFLAMHTTPIQLLPAPPAGFAYVVDSFTVETGAAVATNGATNNNSITGTFSGVSGFATSTSNPGTAAGTYGQYTLGVGPATTISLTAGTGGQVIANTNSLGNTGGAPAVSTLATFAAAHPNITQGFGILGINANHVTANLAGLGLFITNDANNLGGGGANNRVLVTIVYRVLPSSDP